MTTALSGFYAITSEALCRDAAGLRPGVEAALAGGARILQYRDKWTAPDRRPALARQLREACRQAGALFIVNDDIELAAACDADGVHLGRSDGSVASARRRLGDAAIVGVSCSGRVERAIEAQAEGASYAALGRFFVSTTKPDAPPAELDALRRARAALRIPLCAIGGITPDNAAPLIAAGADMIAAVEGVFGRNADAAAMRAAAGRYAALFSASRLQSPTS